MAAALAAIADFNTRGKLAVTGTGWAVSHAYTAKIRFLGTNSPTLTLKGNTDAGGALDTSDVADIEVNEEGNIEVTVSDGTSSVTETARVWHAG